MRTLKYAILGLILQHPCTGYDIAREFKERAFVYRHTDRVYNSGYVG